MIDNQFYPTPPELKAQVWKKIKGTPQYLLEGSAGRGDLLEGHCSRCHDVDVVELDLTNAEILRSKGYRVVGNDFLNFSTPKQYDTVIINPPFRNGVRHTLHAFDNVLKEGQVVSIINAQSIRNPNDKYRQRLVKLIEAEGNEVEFIESAFMAPDVQRTTNVEVALISLHKTRNINLEYDFLDDLTKGDFPDKQQQPDIDSIDVTNSIAIPQSVIARAVTVYNAACRSLRRQTDLTCRLASTTNYYTNLLEKSLIVNDEEKPVARGHDDDPSGIESHNERLNTIKERAWSTVLTQTKIGRSLSSAVVKDLQARFEQVKALEFTEHNIIAFLHGLAAQASDMQMSMLQDVHQSMISYGHENQVYFSGWKSNDKHRVAFRIRTTRIILPLRRCSVFGSISWSEMQTFKDIDLAMDLLAGRHECQYQLYEQMKAHEKQGSDRFDAGYFEVRMYSQSVHLYPQSKQLIDRLNLWVGRSRNWIPPETSASEDTEFWTQYKSAEKFQKDLLSSPGAKDSTPWRLLHNMRDSESQARETSRFQSDLIKAAESKGFNMDFGTIDSRSQSALEVT